MNFQWQNRY